MSETGGGVSASEGLMAGASLAEGVFGVFAAGAQARQLRNNARSRELQGLAESNQRAREGREAVAAGAAIAGASGFTLEGSATDVLARMAAEAETNSARARWEAHWDAEQMRYEAKVRKRQAWIGLGVSILKSAAVFA